MTSDHKKAWICPICHCNKRKSILDSTAISSLDNCSSPTIIDSSHRSKVTVRRAPPSKIEYKSINSEDLNDLGDTRNNTPFSVKEKIINEPLTLQNINLLMELNLQENNKSILAELRVMVQSQIEDALKDLKTEIKEQRECVEREQLKTKVEIDNLHSRINQLHQDLNRLKTDSQRLKADLQNSTYIADETKLTYDPAKTFVLYGLTENYWESNDETYDRVINTVYDILNVDLTGYVEVLTRLGKRGTRRPIKIELISKRMTNYLLSCGQYFKNTGIAISEYLNKQALQDKRTLKEEMLTARRNGQHAVFRNNKLLINGKETTVQDLRNKKLPYQLSNPQRTSEISTHDNNCMKLNDDPPLQCAQNESETTYSNSNLQHNFRSFRN